jgi:hypothetical protein
MLERSVTVIALLAVLLPAAASALARPAGSDGEVVEGTVVQIRNRVQTGNEGELQQITVRTRQGEMVQLMLGDPEACPGECLMVGDQVRARIATRTRTRSHRQVGSPEEAGGEPARVRSLKVRRTGQEIALRNAAGELIRARVQTRVRAQDGTGAGTSAGAAGPRGGDRDRTHAPTRGGRRGGRRGG